jgi:predicted DNA-binding antitoxin AbrB/MazE fold protein
MSIKCEAIVEKGMLRPLKDLGLADADRVLVTVERIGKAGVRSEPSERAQLAAAARALLPDYEAGGELTVFTTLDGEDFGAQG